MVLRFFYRLGAESRFAYMSTFVSVIISFTRIASSGWRALMTRLELEVARAMLR